MATIAAVTSSATIRRWCGGGPVGEPAASSPWWDSLHLAHRLLRGPAGGYDGAGWSGSPASTSSTLSRISPSVSMRLISPYSAAVSASPVRNQVAPETSHSSTSSNSARTRSLATPRILSSYTRGRFVTSPASVCSVHAHSRLLCLMIQRPPITRGGVNLAALARAGCHVPGGPGAVPLDRREHVRSEPADRCAAAHRA